MCSVIATDWYICFHLVFCKSCHTICTNVLNSRHWLSIFSFVRSVSIILSESHDAVCPTALTREQNRLCSFPSAQDFQLLLRPMSETFISVKKKWRQHFWCLEWGYSSCHLTKIQTPGHLSDYGCIRESAGLVLTSSVLPLLSRASKIDDKRQVSKNSEIITASKEESWSALCRTLTW